MRERRFKQSRRPHKVFLVVCEGETEAEYVSMLKRNYRLPVTIKTRVSGNALNSRLVNQYLKELGLGRDDECSIFYIYDADIDCIVKKLNGLPGKPILSNPTVELWYLLHSKNCRRFISSESIARELSKAHPVWQPYTKGKLSEEQRNFLFVNQKEASLRSEKLAWPSNPSTNMYEFIDILEAEIHT